MLIQTYVSAPRVLRSKVAFVDRDGVINANRPTGVLTRTDFEFLPRALEGLALLARHDWTVVVITNQANINRGMMAATALVELHDHMAGSVRRAGGEIAAVLACPHRPDESCPCRKPAPGMLREAARIAGSDVRAAVVIGDHWTDLEAARAVQCRSVLVLSGRVDRASLDQSSVQPDLVVSDLFEAARHLVYDRTAASNDANKSGGNRC